MYSFDPCQNGVEAKRILVLCMIEFCVSVILWDFFTVKYKIGGHVQSIRLPIWRDRFDFHISHADWC